MKVLISFKVLPSTVLLFLRIKTNCVLVDSQLKLNWSKFKLKNPKFSFCKKEVIHLGIYGLISPCHLPSKKLLNFDKKSAKVFDKKTQKSSLIAQGMSFYCNSIGQYETADRQTQNKTKLKKKRKRRNKFAKKTLFSQCF